MLAQDNRQLIKVMLAYYKTWPGPIGLAWPGPKVGLASILASTQILAWPQKCPASNLASKIFFGLIFFQNSDLFRDVLTMISMIK